MEPRGPLWRLNEISKCPHSTNGSWDPTVLIGGSEVATGRTAGLQTTERENRPTSEEAAGLGVTSYPRPPCPRSASSRDPHDGEAEAAAAHAHPSNQGPEPQAWPGQCLPSAPPSSGTWLQPPLVAQCPQVSGLLRIRRENEHESPAPRRSLYEEKAHVLLRLHHHHPQHRHGRHHHHGQQQHSRAGREMCSKVANTCARNQSAGWEFRIGARAVWPWGSHSTSLSFSFLILEMKILPTSGCHSEDEMS